MPDRHIGFPVGQKEPHRQRWPWNVSDPEGRANRFAPAGRYCRAKQTLRCVFASQEWNACKWETATRLLLFCPAFSMLGYVVTVHRSIAAPFPRATGYLHIVHQPRHRMANLLRPTTSQIQ